MEQRYVALADAAALPLLIVHMSLPAGKVLPDAGQPANGHVITTAAGQQCLPLRMICKPDGKLEFLRITLGQVGSYASPLRGSTSGPTRLTTCLLHVRSSCFGYCTSCSTGYCTCKTLLPLTVGLRQLKLSAHPARMHETSAVTCRIRCWTSRSGPSRRRCRRRCSPALPRRRRRTTAPRPSWLRSTSRPQLRSRP